MKLKEISKIQQGTFISRVESKNKNENEIEVEVLSIQNHTEIFEGRKFKVTKIINVKKERINQIIFAKKGDIIYSVTNMNAIIWESELENIAIPSNFIVISDININNYYIAMVLNYSDKLRYKINLTAEGSVLKVVKISTLRDFDINIRSDIALIGGIYCNIIKLNNKMEDKKNNLTKIIKGVLK